MGDAPEAWSKSADTLRSVASMVKAIPPRKSKPRLIEACDFLSRVRKTRSFLLSLSLIWNDRTPGLTKKGMSREPTVPKIPLGG